MRSRGGTVFCSVPLYSCRREIYSLSESMGENYHGLVGRFVVHIPGWIQDLMERLVSILKWGTKRNVFRIVTLYTDASNLGWGAYLEGSWAFGLWSPLQQKEHINLLEIGVNSVFFQNIKKTDLERAELPFPFEKQEFVDQNP
jgi:hypothetical protein